MKLSREISELRSRLFGRVEEIQDEYQAKGWLPARLNLNKGIIRGLLELFAWGQWQLYNFLAVVHKQAVPADSDGDWLDLHARQVAEGRKLATKAVGKIKFMRGDGNGNVLIPKGRIVRTLPDGNGRVFRYVTTASSVLPAGEDSVLVEAEAEEYGADSNASAGQICELVTPVAGISGVANSAEWLMSEGANEESDSQLRERYSLAWAANNGCTKYAYMAWALRVPGVTSVSILDQHPRGQGTVDIVVRGSDILPTDALLEKVRGAIAPNAPINDDWLVKGPVPVPCRIDGAIEYIMGDPEAIRHEAENRIRAMFAETSPIADVTAMRIGQDLTLDLLTHTLMAVAGIKRVIWQSPQADVVRVAPDGVATLESLNLTIIQASEE